MIQNSTKNNSRQQSVYPLYIHTCRENDNKKFAEIRVTFRDISIVVM